MKLYSYWRSSCSWRVRIVLNYKSIPYEIVPVDLSPAAQAQQGSNHRARNAMGQVPTLEWEECGAVRRISQSVAIIEYLEERHPERALLPRQPYERALVRQAVELVNSGIQPLQNTGTLAQVAAIGGQAAMGVWGTRFIERGLDALEIFARVHSGGFLVGDAPSLADVFLVPQLYNARRFEIEVARFPTLAAVEERASGIVAFARAHPSAQPDCPDRSAP